MSQNPKVVIFNDTSTRYHHGCARVMRLLCAGLERHGLEIIARSPARHEWEKDAAFLAELARADIIVINGEGTLHHGKPAGEALLRVTQHPARGTTPVALINAHYQDNPDSWNEMLQACALLSARDSESAAAMQAASGQDVRWLPDLSLSAPAEGREQARKGVIVGDSVKLSARKVLAMTAARFTDARFVPTKTLQSKIWNSAIMRGLLYRIYNGVFPLHTPPFLMPATEEAYLKEIAATRLHITGRFHAVCLSMLVETPFLALSSNASKIERLLTDAGLGKSRMADPARLKQASPEAPFSGDELTAIRAFRQMASERAEILFADIAALGGQS
ncbi:MAG: polysaccharide pyruvyl transferase family protein [Yoonia sp.]